MTDLWAEFDQKTTKPKNATATTAGLWDEFDTPKEEAWQRIARERPLADARDLGTEGFHLVRNGQEQLIPDGYDFAAEAGMTEDQRQAALAAAAAFPITELGSVQAETVPDRSWSDVGTDTATRIRQTLNNVVGGVIGAPTNIANLPGQFPRQMLGLADKFGLGDYVPALARDMAAPIQQPDAVQGMREGLSQANEAEESNLSPKALAQAKGFNATEGLGDALMYLAENPSYAGVEALGQLPQFLQIVPGSAAGTIAAQSIGAGSQNAQQVEEELIKKGATPAEAAAAATTVFAASAGINAAIPLATPGGTAVERMIANRVSADVGTTAASRVAIPLLGETLSEGGVEGLDQVIQNLGTGNPVTEGVGRASALGMSLGAGPGAVAGVTNAIVNRDPAPIAPDAAPTNAVAPMPPELVQALGDLSPEVLADLDALLTQNQPAPAETPPTPVTAEPTAQPLADADPNARFRRPESAPAAPPADTATQVRTSLPAQTLTPAQAVQAPAVADGSRPAGADLNKLGDWTGGENRQAPPVAPTREAAPTPYQMPEAKAEPVAETVKAPRKRAVKTDPKTNKPLDLLRVIAANGGLNREAFRSQGVDPAEFTRRAGFNYVFRKEGGMGLGELREFMQQEGYLARDVENALATVDDNDALDVFDRAFRGGEAIYSDDQGEAVAAQQRAQREADEAMHEELRAAPELSDVDDFDVFMAGENLPELTTELSRLTERAYDLGASDEAILAAGWDAETGDERIAALTAIIEGLENESNESAPAGDPESRVEPREEAQPAALGDFALETPAQPAAQEVGADAALKRWHKSAAGYDFRNAEPAARASFDRGFRAAFDTDQFPAEAVDNRPMDQGWQAGKRAQEVAEQAALDNEKTDTGEFRPIAQPQSGLFGAPKAADFVQAAIRNRDDKRNGKSETATPGFSGTDLGAGAAPVQASVPDAEPKRSPDFLHNGWATRNSRLGDEYREAQNAVRKVDAQILEAEDAASIALPPGYQTIPYPERGMPDGVALQDADGNDIAYPLSPSEASERAWREAGRDDRYAAVEALERKLAPQLTDLRAKAKAAREAWDANGDSPMEPTWKAEREAKTAAEAKQRETAAKAARTREEKKQAKADKPKAKPTEALESPDAAPAKIEDVGEKLGGARKDRAPSLSRDLSDEDIAAQPLSKIWPAEEIDGIENVLAAATAYAARAEIPPKPRVKYKVDRWVKTVNLLRGLAQSVVNADMTHAQMVEVARKNGRGLDGFLSKINLLQELPRDTWGRVGSVGEHPDAYRFTDHVTIKTPIVQVEIDGKNHRFDASAVGEVLDQVRELLGAAKAGKAMAFEVRGKEGAWGINKKGDKEYRKLKTFADAKEALAFVRDNNAALVELWEGVKDSDNVKKTDTRREDNRERAGTDHRDGKAVTGDQFVSTFGFRGVEFGNWVSQGGNAKERQGMLNQAFDALMDLAGIVGVPPKALSLNGSLGLGFGSRGSGKASAHFEPGNLVINLTKTRGAGALAHEWFHALDNYFARMRGGEKAFTGNQNAYREGNFITYRPEPLYVHVRGGKGMTEAELARQRERNPQAAYYRPENWRLDPSHPEGVRPEVERSFAALVDVLNASPMANRARNIDKKADGYWSQIIERGARSFENYVIFKMTERGVTNDYLANVRTIEDFPRAKNRYPYLLPEEVAPVAEAFDDLFAVIESREDADGNVALYNNEPVAELADADLTPAERAAFARQSGEASDNAALRESMAEQSREDGEADADRYGLRDAVNKVLGNVPGAPTVEFVRDRDGLVGMANLPATNGRKVQTAALYSPVDQRVFIITSVVKDPARAAWHAAHEIAGHHGLRSLLGKDLDKALDLALQNPTVQKLADAIGAERKSSDRLLMAEEALSELAAAVRTDNFDHITERYGVAVPTGIRAKLVAAIDNFLKRLKALFDGLLGKDTFTDEDVRGLLEAAWQAVASGDNADPASMDSADLDELLQEHGQPVDNDVDALKRWTNGERLFVMHDMGDDATEVTDLDMLKSATPDQLLALPRALAASLGIESTDYTPEQQAFMRKAGMGNAVDTRTTMQRVSDWALGKKPDISGDAAIQAGFDQFHGLKRAVNEKGGLDPADDPYLAARQIQMASTMEAILRFGAPKLVDGALRVDRSIPGLMDALAPVAKQMPQFLGWMVARRAQVLKKQGRENLLSDADIAAGLSLATGHEAAFAKAALGYLKLKNAILDLAEQSGTIDPVARAAWDHAEYIPFYRDTEAGGGPGTKQGLANQSAGIRTLKGGDTALMDPLANIIQNFTKLVDSAMKNRATLLAVDGLGAPYFRKAMLAMKPETIPADQVRKHLLATGVDQAVIDAMPDAALKGVAKMLAVKAPEGDDIVRVMREGKAEYHHVDDPLLLRALTAFNEGTTHAAVKPLIWAKQLLTAGATATPEFLVANAIRDTGEASVTAQDAFIPVWDTVRGAIESFSDSELAQDLMMAGSSFHSGLFHTGNNDDTAKAIKRALRAHGLTDNAVEKYAKSLINPKRWWDGYRAVAEATEMGSRISLARQRLAAGATFVEAAHEAKDFLDFQMRGDDAFVQFFLKVIPFLNARLQGGYRLARVGSTKGRRGPLAVKLGMMVLASSALVAWNAMMYADGYDDLEEFDKDANWHIAPGTANHIRIPKPFELGYVGGTLPERMYAAIRYQLTKGEAGDRPGQSFDSLMHFVMHTMMFNPIPQGVKPIVEDRANRNFYFDSPIEGMGDENKAPSDRYTPTTSLTMRKASKAMAAIAGEDNAVSPKRLAHLWRGYTAGMGDYVLDSVDWILRTVGQEPQRPARALRDFPVIGRFARGDTPPAATRYTGEFYDLREQMTVRSNQIKGALKDGDSARAKRLEAEWGWLVGDREDSKRAKGGFMHTGVRAAGKVADELAALRKRDAAIYDDRAMTPAEKRAELDANALARNTAAKKMVRRIRERERTLHPGRAPMDVRPSSLPESRRAQYVGIGKPGAGNVAPDVLQGAKNAPTMVMVGDWSGLPKKIATAFDGGALGVFDPESKKVYVGMGMDEAETKFTAYHEIAGHYGLQGALGNDYETTLNRAMQNPTVDKLARAMREGGGLYKGGYRLAMTEEALSELAAAQRMGDYSRIKREWGIDVPTSAQTGLKGMLSRVGQLTKRTLADLTGEEPDAFDDEQVYSLIADAWRYVER